MSVRTAYVGTQSAGQVLTSANFSKLPGGWIGDASVTAGQSGITTVTSLTGLTVTVTVGTNRRIRISFGAIITTTVVGDIALLRVKEGSTGLQLVQAAPSKTNGESYMSACTLTPTSGSHTYFLTLERLSGTGTEGIAASSDAPAFILVEDIGPAS